MSAADLDDWAEGGPHHPELVWWREVGSGLWQRADGVYVALQGDGFITFPQGLGQRVGPEDFRRIWTALTARLEQAGCLDSHDLWDEHVKAILMEVDGLNPCHDLVQLASVAFAGDADPYNSIVF